MNLGKPEEKESASCAVCGLTKTVEVTLLRQADGGSDSAVVSLCGRPCFYAYKFANSVDAFPCGLCAKEVDVKLVSEAGSDFVVRESFFRVK